MEHKDAFLLESIINYCDKLSDYLTVNKIDKAGFLNNPYHQDICAFYCLQIGENANSLSDKFIASHREIEWRNIIGLRNIIAHEYGSIDATMLWEIITDNIPELHDFCVELIKQDSIQYNVFML